MSEKAVLLANRLGDILKKLNSGETISVKSLSIEFSVSERTIQKDLNERLDPSLIEPLGNGLYRLVPGFLGNLTPKDIKEFSELSGIIDLYPNIDDIIKHKIRGSLLVNSTINKGCIPKSADFKEINYVITENLKLKFSYNNKDLIVSPLKLINNRGIWYLLCINNKDVKSYCVHRMRKVRRDVNKFIPDKLLVKEIESNPSPWFRLDKIMVLLRVKPDFTSYFLDRNIISDYNKLEKKSDGSLLLSLEVNSLEEIKGIIKFWIPKIEVVKPIELKNIIINEIKDFLN